MCRLRPVITLLILLFIALIFVPARAAFTAVSVRIAVGLLPHPAQGKLLDPNIGSYRLVFPIILSHQTIPAHNLLWLPIVVKNEATCNPPKLDDPYYLSYQIDMHQIHTEQAWVNCVLSNHNIRVAVIDTGVNLTHPDLEINVLPGYDFVDNDTSPEDGHGHGSNVAGIVAAAANSLGVIGVAPQAGIVPVRVLDNDGSGYTSWVVNGIRFAADNAQIINLSLGSIQDDAFIYQAIQYTLDAGRLVVAAAGNCADASNYMNNGCQFVNQTIYPAAYPGVMAVGAVKDDDKRANFSNQGFYIDITAPGVNIFNVDKNNGYTSLSGTSQATPHVAGLAALVWSLYPTHTAIQVRQIIEQTAIDLGDPGWDPQYGWGRIDAGQAMNMGSAVGDQQGAVNNSQTGINQQYQGIDDRQASIAPGRILVQFNPGVNVSDMLQAQAASGNIAQIGEIPGLAVQILQVPAGQEWYWVDAFRRLREVRLAGPDYWIQFVR